VKLLAGIAMGVLLIGCGGTLAARRFARLHGLIDVPNARSSHLVPTARGGGVAIVAAFAAGVLCLCFLGLIDSKTIVALLAGGGAVAAIGFFDDLRPLPPAVRFAVHLAAALIAAFLLGGIPQAGLESWGLHGSVIGIVLAVLAILWSINLFNFMDGIDGIAASEAIFVAAAGAWLNLSAGGDPGLTGAMLCLGAACLGFLIWNWPPASIFMGDVGSGFLGFTLIALALALCNRSGIAVEVWPILGGVFLVDATVTLLRRVLRGDRWTLPHRMHAYQRLARRFRGHRPVTLIVIAIDVFWLLPWARHAALFPATAARCLLFALLPLVALAVIAGAGARND
jgi:Fuc2NAc and GlcNAc transferase